MSISFAGVFATPYIGAPYSVPIQAASQGARIVPLQFNWLTYCYLTGEFQDAVAVNVNLQGGQGSPAPLLSQYRSVYIDNTGSNVPIYVQCTDTGYTVTAQPYTVGWYPIFTNSSNFIIAGLNFNATAIPQTNVMFANIFVRPFTDTALQSTLNNSLSSQVIGGGAGLFTILIINPGTWYANGNLNIAGGGGGGGTAEGTISAYGQFSNIIIEDEGLYLGLPTVTATAAQNAPPAWVAGQASRAGVTQCSYVGTTWQSGGTWQAGNEEFSFTPPDETAVWSNLNISSTPVTAQFLAVLTPVSNSIITSGYAPPALGDQAASYIDTVTADGVFRNNLFGTPFSSGFIYLTHFQAKIVAAADNTTAIATWEFVSSDGSEAPFQMAFQNNAGFYNLAEAISLQKMNVKLDATKTWQLNMTSIAGGNPTIFMHAFAWTYSQY